VEVVENVGELAKMARSGRCAEDTEEQLRRDGEVGVLELRLELELELELEEGQEFDEIASASQE